MLGPFLPSHPICSSFLEVCKSLHSHWLLQAGGRSEAVEFQSTKGAVGVNLPVPQLNHQPPSCLPVLPGAPCRGEIGDCQGPNGRRAKEPERRSQVLCPQKAEQCRESSGGGGGTWQCQAAHLISVGWVGIALKRQQGLWQNCPFQLSRKY